MIEDIKKIPSPNHDDRDGQAIDMLVMHYTGMKDGARALERLTDAESQVSAHYVVDELGGVFSLVDEQMRAWHAGKAYWRGHTNINQRSIGIEIINPGHEFGYRPFPDVQMHSVIKLCQEILSRHDIPARNVIGHSDVAPTRKQDPGELFDWAWLAKQGIGLWALGIKDKDLEQEGRPVGRPSLEPAKQCSMCEQKASAGALKDFGYDTTDLPAAIIAFQRHFRPHLLTGKWDDECERVIAQLLAV